MFWVVLKFPESSEAFSETGKFWRVLRSSYELWIVLKGWWRFWGLVWQFGVFWRLVFWKLMKVLLWCSTFSSVLNRSGAFIWILISLKRLMKVVRPLLTFWSVLKHIIDKLSDILKEFRGDLRCSQGFWVVLKSFWRFFIILWWFGVIMKRSHVFWWILKDSWWSWNALWRLGCWKVFWSVLRHSYEDWVVMKGSQRLFSDILAFWRILRCHWCWKIPECSHAFSYVPSISERLLKVFWGVFMGFE